MKYVRYKNLCNGLAHKRTRLNLIENFHKCLQKQFVITSSTDDRHYVLGFYNCGCRTIQKVALSSVKGFNSQCKFCEEDRFKREAEEHNFKLVSKVDRTSYREYECKSCKKCIVRSLYSMRKGSVSCYNCTSLRYAKEAQDSGCEYLGESVPLEYGKSLYKLPCGCVRTIHRCSVKTGKFKCQNCYQYYYNQPSKLYLYKIQIADFKFLKLGVSKDVSTRHYGYGISTDYKIETVFELRFEKSNLCISNRK